MNCFDFDKTIYRKDSSLKFYFYCFFKSPRMFFHFLGMLFLFVAKSLKMISTKKFKEKFFSFLKYFSNTKELVDKFWAKEKKNIANWYLQIKKETDVICSASPEFLIKPIMKEINQNCTVVCTNMNILTGKIDGENLKGDEKVKQLKKLGFTSFENVYTDSLSDFPILDLTKNKWIVCGKKVFEFGKQKPTFTSKIKFFIKQLRVKHYLKNGLIFLPLFFSGQLKNSSILLKSLLGFVSFCLIASFVYVVNDLIDVKKDRLHSTKRKRPIASYMVKKSEAIVLAILLFTSSMLVNYFTFGLNYFVFAILIGYAFINLLYSTCLKNFAIIDVYVLASCYLIRLFYGALIISTSVSKWLYLTILFASLFMGFGKRRNEIMAQKEKTRKVNKNYSYNFLDKNLYVCLTLCLIFYSLWVVDFRAYSIGYLNGILLLITIPLVCFLMMRYSLDIEKSTNSGDPIEVLLNDFCLISAALIFVLLIVFAIYIPIPNFFVGG